MANYSYSFILQHSTKDPERFQLVEIIPHTCTGTGISRDLPKFMVKDTQKDFTYQLVPTYCTDGILFLKCRLKHTKCSFMAYVFPIPSPEMNRMLKTGHLFEAGIIAIFGDRNDLEIYNVSNYRGFYVSNNHDKLCYNYLFGELASGMLKTGEATFSFTGHVTNSTFLKSLP